MASLRHGSSRFRQQRRTIVARNQHLKGLERASLEHSKSDWTLRLLFIDSEYESKSPVPAGLSPRNLRISTPEGRADQRLRVLGVVRQGRTVLVDLEPPPGTRGLFEGTVEIVDLPHIDPFFASADFPELSQERPEQAVPMASVEDLVDSSKINYMARDYETFRQLMLDRMSEFIPEWDERNPSDLGVAIIEVLAYSADHLSYQQDSLGAEAYLGTARRRISVARHARLLDYSMHQGCNSRTWVDMNLPEGSERLHLRAGTQFLTSRPGASDPSRPDQSDMIAPGSTAYDQAISSRNQVFESVQDVVLEPGKQALELYTWGAEDFSLPRGSTTGTLVGEPPLEKGDLLAFSQLAGGGPNPPGETQSAGISSHVVRLSQSPKRGRDVATGVRLTEVTWHIEDALPIDLWVSRRTAAGVVKNQVAVSGNLVLADHGRTQSCLLPSVPEHGVYEPRLPIFEKLTHRVELDLDELRARPAAWALEQSARQALPAIRLEELGFESSQTEAHASAARLAAAAAASAVWIETDEERPSAGSTEKSVESISAEVATVGDETRAAAKGSRQAAVELQVAIDEAFGEAQSVGEDLGERLREALAATEAAEDAAAAAAQAASAAGAAGGELERLRKQRADGENPYEAEVENAVLAAQEAVAAASTAADAAADAAQRASYAAGAARVAARRASAAYDGGDGNAVWKPRRDLIGCTPFDRAFVVQMESGGELTLRFGDGRHGRKPYAGTRFRAIYRVGSGPVGNLGANTIGRVASSGLLGVTNPVPAIGGRPQEELERVRRVAPAAARQERRCITPEDYAVAARRHPEVVSASARLSWTGSWNTAFLHVQRSGGRSVDETFEAELSHALEPLLPIGTDLKVCDPRWAPLVLHLTVTLAQGHLSGSVEARLRDRLGAGVSESGELGLFHPDCWAFGKPVHLSGVVGAALDVRGVATVVVDRFQRRGMDDPGALAAGEIKVGALEIASLHSNRGDDLVINVRGGQ